MPCVCVYIFILGAVVWRYQVEKDECLQRAFEGNFWLGKLGGRGGGRMGLDKFLKLSTPIANPRVYDCMQAHHIQQTGHRLGVLLPILLVGQGKSLFPCPRSRLTFWFRERGSAVPSRASPLILHTQTESGASFRDPLLPPTFCHRVHPYRQPP